MRSSDKFLAVREYLGRQVIRNVAWYWEDDSGYRDWARKNVTGFVFNAVKDGNLVLHRAACSTIADAKAHFGIKVCSNERANLESICRTAVGEDPRLCQRCLTESERHGNGGTRNLHLPLPNQLYSQLRDEAGRLDRPITAVARQAIEEWLVQRRKAAVHDAIAAYVTEMTGTGVDLDPALEAASLEYLAESERQL